MKPDDLPDDWKTVSLSELFTPEQLTHIETTCRTHDLDKSIELLRPFFLALRPQLEPKGLLPEYATYAVTYRVWLACYHEKS